MSRLTRNGTAKPVSRDQTFMGGRGKGSTDFPCLTDHEQDWQPYTVDPCYCYMCNHTNIHTYTLPKKGMEVEYLVLCKYTCHCTRALRQCYPRRVLVRRGHRNRMMREKGEERVAALDPDSECIFQGVECILFETPFSSHLTPVSLYKAIALPAISHTWSRPWPQDWV